MSSLKSRFWYWSNSQPELEFVAKWRTPGRTKLLVITYFTALVLALIFELSALLWVHSIWFFVVFLMIAMTAWTVLRNTIKMKDAAPREALDDYEQAVLDRWRERALSVLNVLLMGGGIVAIFAGVFFTEAISTELFAVVVGLYMIFSYLTVSTLPAIGFALTFNQPTED